MTDRYRADGPALDEHLDERSALDELLEGLRDEPRRISSKYHYDEHGSELFEEITRLDEYYPTRTERSLLERWMPDWVSDLRPATLVELGAGSAEKSRVILDAMVAAGSGRAYVPVDVSADFLAATAEALRRDYPDLAIEPEVADISEPVDLPAGLPGPRWFAFLGSTLGNFQPSAAVSLLRRIGDRLGSDDHFLLGVDLRPSETKPVERVERAYNDAAGVTARFSLNILNVVNREFGSDFDPKLYRHLARYDADAGRIETYLVAAAPHEVRFPGGETLRIDEGEMIRSEVSAKYDRPVIDALFEDAGMRVERWIEDPESLYALVLGTASD